MNPYLNSLNGWGAGFIAFWVSIITVVAPPPPSKQYLHGWNRQRLLQWGGRFKNRRN